ncbi:transposable element Tcb2 transposase [Trichonephila clavipes]|nr:transposable element Tcb2 transposase [Trichonephila clavipes]
MSKRGETVLRSIGSSDKFHATVGTLLTIKQDCGRGFKEREMLPDNQYQVDQESQPLAKTDIWRLNHAGLYARGPSVCIPLTSAHKRARLNWSLKHQHWSMGEWANVMFSDETRFSLSSDSLWVTIWREHGTRFEPRNITERHHFPSRGVMTYFDLKDFSPHSIDSVKGHASLSPLAREKAKKKKETQIHKVEEKFSETLRSE